MIEDELEEFENYFNKAYHHAKLHSTCTKLAVGSLFRRSDEDDVYLGCNKSDEINCRERKICNKFKVTGIYESNEETRKYCVAKHAEIDLLDQLRKDNISPSSGTVYVTRYPCRNCMQTLADAGVKRIYYCGKSEGTDPEFNNYIASKYNIDLRHFPQFDYEFKKEEE